MKSHPTTLISNHHDSSWIGSEVPGSHESFPRHIVHIQPAGILPCSLSYTLSFTILIVVILPLRVFHLLYHGNTSISVHKEFSCSFYGCTIFLFIDIPWLMYQSPSDRYLHYFQSFAVANNAALDNLSCVSL